MVYTSIKLNSYNPKHSKIMEHFNNLEDLFQHQLKDIYSAESQWAEVLPKMREQSSNKELQNCFSEHIEQTKNHRKQLDKIAKEMDVDLSGVKCEGMEGLINQANDFISSKPGKDVLDAGLIAEAQRIEHYGMSAYGTAAQYADALNHKEAAKQLHQILQEETNTDKKLSKIAEDSINRQAAKNR